MTKGPDDMCRKRLLRIAAIVLTIGAVAGCGGGFFVGGTATLPTSSSRPMTTTPDPTDSALYCQQRPGDGKWVTNEAGSATPCVPDPSYATGDEDADASVAIPRCFSCKLSDWERAEQRAAKRPGSSSPATDVAIATTNSASPGSWSAGVSDSFISACTEGRAGAVCDCLANHLDWQVPSDEAQTLSGEDPRVQVAVQDCRP